MIDREANREFGEYIKQLRMSRGMTLEEVQSALNKAGSPAMSLAYLSLLERGKRNPPTRKVLVGLAGVYGVELKEILTRAGRVSKEVPSEFVPPTDAVSTKAALDRLQAAWRFICSDPDLALSEDSKVSELPIWAKLAIVTYYQEATDRRLFMTGEKLALHRLGRAIVRFGFERTMVALEESDNADAENETAKSPKDGAPAA